MEIALAFAQLQLAEKTQFARRVIDMQNKLAMHVDQTSGRVDLIAVTEIAFN
jgi:hypothetical protein